MDNLIAQLTSIAKTSSMNNKHASVIFTSFNKPICFGVNDTIRNIITGAIEASIHAEADSINNLPFKILQQLKSWVLQVYLSRIRRAEEKGPL